jgi:Zn-finger nucleic acid-binding protein
MICPACKNQMVALEYKQVELDYCNSCGGVWFDNTELELLMNLLNLDKNGLIYQDLMKLQEANLPRKSCRCPICNGRMKLINIGVSEGIIIDICPHGHGLWFDGGELAQLIRQKCVGSGISSDVQSMLDYLGEVFQGES